ncbi:Uncharacterised protein [Vibrio cholerae]|nr:Uncharacterised protein [Vibrio cholerae]CSI89983.1 Uncharacterised protein [Vibrio cholerae]
MNWDITMDWDIMLQVVLVMDLILHGVGMAIIKDS